MPQAATGTNREQIKEPTTEPTLEPMANAEEERASHVPLASLANRPVITCKEMTKEADEPIDFLPGTEELTPPRIPTTDAEIAEFFRTALLIRG